MWHLNRIKLSTLDGGVRLLKLRFPIAQRFHLAALERNAALELGLDVIIVKRLAVLDSRGEIGFLVAGHCWC